MEGTINKEIKKVIDRVMRGQSSSTVSNAESHINYIVGAVSRSEGVFSADIKKLIEQVKQLEAIIRLQESRHVSEGITWRRTAEELPDDGKKVSMVTTYNPKESIQAVFVKDYNTGTIRGKDIFVSSDGGFYQKEYVIFWTEALKPTEEMTIAVHVHNKKKRPRNEEMD